MAHGSPDNQSLARDAESFGSSGSIDSPILRQGNHRRMDSQGSPDLTDPVPQYTSPLSSSNLFEPVGRASQGLGISQRQSITRVPVGSRGSLSPPTPGTPFASFPSPKSSPKVPGSTRPLLSTTFPKHGSGSYAYNGVGPVGEAEEQDVANQRYTDNLDTAFRNMDDQRDETFMNNDNEDNRKLLGSCPAKHDIHSRRTSWLSMSILILSIYSTVFSGIWLFLALVQPRYGRAIHSGGSFTPATASILFALFAKTIELSFVTVFVTFIGQVLSRRSLVKNSRGITIAEMTMRTWVIQPGFMITHWQHLQHAALTILGIISLTAAIMAMFYTTASDALVSPQLRYGRWNSFVMSGLVKTSYSNPTYLKNSCQTPISAVEDGYTGSICLDIQHAGQAYHNSVAYLGTWAGISEEGTGVSSDLAERPQAPGMLFDNTTVVGSWVFTNSSNMTASYEKYNRIINNVTLSMPHAGVIAASKDPKNGILQPEELEGVGEYSVSASVVSPSVNVLCVNMNTTEVAPLIYTLWPNAITTNSSEGQKLAWSGYESEVQVQPGKEFLNSTVVDDIFEWGPTYGRQPPVFPMLPIEFNSLTNLSTTSTSGVGNALYLLIKAQDLSTLDYTICQLQSFLSPFCSTSYNVSGLTGGHLQAVCEDPHDRLTYNKSVPDPPVSIDADWRNAAQEWMLALSMDTGISNSNSSTTRLLSDFISTTPSWGDVKLNPLKPSISETLAVMAGNTLLLGTIDSTFVHYWQYTSTVLDPGVYENFNASISSQQYASGLEQKWQGIFYIVLFLVFVTNLFCLVYFFLRSGLVTDYTEPQNLFAIAVNSPPSGRLSGSCGAGPEAEQLSIDWHVAQQDSTGHFFIKEGVLGPRGEYELRKKMKKNLKPVNSYTKLSSARSSWL